MRVSDVQKVLHFVGSVSSLKQARNQLESERPISVTRSSERRTTGLFWILGALAPDWAMQHSYPHSQYTPHGFQFTSGCARVYSTTLAR